MKERISKKKAVLDALADDRWDYRTLKGLKASTGLSEDQIRRILGGYADLVRASPIPSKNGDPLYTLASRDRSSKDYLRILQAYISKSP